jgi:hypothetical protein
MIGSDYPEVSVLDRLETPQDAYPPGDAEEVAEQLAKVDPEDAIRDATLAQRETDLLQSGDTLAEVDHTTGQRVIESNAATIKGYRERISIGTACNAGELAAQINALQMEINFLTGTGDLLKWRIIPAQKLRKLEAGLACCEIKYLRATLQAHALAIETQKRLGGVYAIQGTIGILGGHSQELDAITAEAKRQVGLAKTALREEKNRQATTDQRRMACAQLTRAEILVPAPCYE